MNINLKRTIKTDLSTIGEVSIDEVFQCFSLERLEVQIPSGVYPVEITYSPRFNRPLPLLDGTEPRTDIRIHAGNWARDTDGCILVGLGKGPDIITQSLLALNPLVEKIQAALDAGDEVTISIS